MKIKTSVVAVAVAGVALALTGCGQAAEQAAEEAAEQAIEAQGGGDVEIDADGESFSVEGEDGSEFSVGSDELPDDFPAEVPIPEGGTVESSSSVQTDGKAGWFEDMREGFRFVTSRPKLLMLTFLAFAGTFLGMPIVTFLPVVAKSIFGLKANGYAWMMTTYGIGSVTGALLIAATAHAAKKGKMALELQLAFACLLIGFAFSRSLPLSLVIAFFAGICIVGVIALYSSLVQLTASDDMRGRVMSIFMLAFRGGMPLGNLLAGYVAQRWSITVALAVNGTVLASVALFFIARRTKLDE